MRFPDLPTASPGYSPSQAADNPHTGRHRTYRIEGVVVAHIYPCIGILTHDLPALRESAVEYFPLFRWEIRSPIPYSSDNANGETAARRTPCDAPFWTLVLGFATDNGRFANNSAVRSREWQHAGLLVTSRQGDESPPERASGQQLDACPGRPRGRDVRQAGRECPARCPEDSCSQCQLGGGAGAPAKAACFCVRRAGGAVIHVGWYYNNLATLPSRQGGQTPPLAQPGLARGRSAWTSEHTK
jgi:hypothetical protein